MEPGTIVRHGEILAVPTDGAVMFMHVESGQFLMLAETARNIWFLIDGKRSVGEIIGRLVAEFEVDAETCETEVNAFLKQLHDHGMIDVVS